MNWGWLNELCALPGVSGHEDAVRDWLVAHLPPSATHEVDALGNLLVNPAKGGVMLCAHMDEVGFVITDILDDGYLRFAAVGGLDAAACFGKRLCVGAAALPGVVGSTPPHLLEGDERAKIPAVHRMYIDIGASNRAQAEALVQRGDFATFAASGCELGEEFLAAKALDDRLGCLILLELLHETPGLCAVFSVLEEVGGAAAAAAFALEPTLAIVVETTTAADVPGADGTERVCALGAGAVVPFMDRGTTYPMGLYQQTMQLALAHSILAQTKTMIAGGNDAQSISASGRGVPCITISVPCRGLHSAAVVCKRSDVEATKNLVRLAAKHLLPSRPAR